MFKEAVTDIHEYTETVSDYITFCESLHVHSKTITSYPNDKGEKDAYKDNDKYKKARYAAEKATKTGKAKYRGKLDENLTTTTCP